MSKSKAMQIALAISGVANAMMVSLLIFLAALCNVVLIAFINTAPPDATVTLMDGSVQFVVALMVWLTSVACWWGVGKVTKIYFGHATNAALLLSLLAIHLAYLRSTRSGLYTNAGIIQSAE